MDYDARDRPGLVDLGMVDDVPVLLAREWVEADLRITAGFVEPHFFAGFSGGPKMVAPGLAGLDTTLALHNARRIGEPRATWGVIEGNPVHDAVRAIAARPGSTSRSTCCSTTGSGSPVRSPARSSRCTQPPARKRVGRRCEAVAAPFDIVITTNSGYPLDQNLYQAIKGISAAAEMVRPGGTIICAAECRDGLPDHGSYGRTAPRGPLAGRPAGTHRRLAGHDPRPVAGPDPGPGADEGATWPPADATASPTTEVRAAHLEPIPDIEARPSSGCRRVIRTPRICVLPQGPQTIAYVA